MTLFPLVSHVKRECRGTSCNLQYTDSKHEHDLHLLLERQVEVPQLGHREGDEGYVQHDTDRRGHPRLQVDVSTCRLVGAVPLQPGSRDRGALEDGDDLESEEV